MRTIKKLLALIGIIALVCTCRVFSDNEETKVIGDYWYEVTFQGKKVGYMHSIVEKGKYKGADAYKFTSEDLMKAKRDSDVVSENKMSSVSYTGLDFSPLYAMKKMQDGEQKTITETTISNGKIVFKTTLNDDEPEEKSIDFEKDVIFGVDGLLLKERGLLKVGVEKSFKVVSTGTKSLRTTAIKVLKEETIKVMDEDVASYIVEFTNSEMPGIVAKQNIGSDGAELKTEVAGMVMTRVSKEKAMKFEEVSTISSHIATNVAIPFPHRISQLQLVMKFTERFDDIVPSNEYQQVEKDEGDEDDEDDDEYKVTLNAIPLGIKTSPEIPIVDDSLKKYMMPSLLIQCQDPLIVEKAKEIVGGEKDGLKAVRLITEWVYKNIEKEYSDTAEKSAKEVLGSKSGDCTEHSVLVSALGRAVGLPIRGVDGLIFDGASFGYHQWNEVYLGKWVPVDATTNAVGIPATYIKLGESSEGGKEGSETSARTIKMMAKTSIKIVSFRDNDKNIVDVSRPKKLIVQNKTSYEDKLLGIKVKIPNGWTAMATKVTSGGGVAIFTITGNSAVITPINIKEKLTSQIFDATLMGVSSNLTDVEKGSVEETKVNGYMAFESEISGKSKGDIIEGEVLMKMRLVVCQGNDKTFLILFSSLEKNFDDAVDTFDEILGSIKF